MIINTQVFSTLDQWTQYLHVNSFGKMNNSRVSEVDLLASSQGILEEFFSERFLNEDAQCCLAFSEGSKPETSWCLGLLSRLKIDEPVIGKVCYRLELLFPNIQTPDEEGCLGRVLDKLVTSILEPRSTLIVCKNSVARSYIGASLVKSGFRSIDTELTLRHFGELPCLEQQALTLVFEYTREPCFKVEPGDFIVQHTRLHLDRNMSDALADAYWYKILEREVQSKSGKFCCFCQGGLVGLILFSDSQSPTELGGRKKVRNFFFVGVARRLLGRGIGSFLLHKSILASREAIDVVEVEAYEKNLGAISFYHRAGFHEVRRTKVYHWGHGDLIRGI